MDSPLLKGCESWLGELNSSYLSWCPYAFLFTLPKGLLELVMHQQGSQFGNSIFLLLPID